MGSANRAGQNALMPDDAEQIQHTHKEIRKASQAAKVGRHQEVKGGKERRREAKGGAGRQTHREAKWEVQGGAGR